MTVGQEKYSTPKLTQFGRLEKITGDTYKTFGLSDGVILVNPQDNSQTPLTNFS